MACSHNVHDIHSTYIVHTFYIKSSLWSMFVSLLCRCFSRGKRYFPHKLHIHSAIYIYTYCTYILHTLHIHSTYFIIFLHTFHIHSAYIYMHSTSMHSWDLLGSFSSRESASHSPQKRLIQRAAATEEDWAGSEPQRLQAQL